MSLSTTDASEMSHQNTRKEWEHDHQPGYSYYEDSRSPVALSQAQVLVPPTPDNMSHISSSQPVYSQADVMDYMIHIKAVDDELARMGYPTSPTLLPTRPYGPAFFRYIPPAPRWVGEPSLLERLYHGSYPAGKVPYNEYMATYSRLDGVHRQIVAAMDNFMLENPSFDTKGNLDTKLKKRVEIEVPFEWDNIPGRLLTGNHKYAKCSLDTIGALHEANCIAQRSMDWYLNKFEPVSEDFATRTVGLLDHRNKLTRDLLNLKLTKCNGGDVNH
jgi:hypothetical protein